MGLPCLNCKTDVVDGKGHLFQGVWVCELCYGYAERSFQRLQKELRYLLTMCGEALRQALVEGRLHPPEKQPDEISKEDLLRAVMEVSQKKEAKNREPKSDDGPIRPEVLLPRMPRT